MQPRDRLLTLITTLPATVTPEWVGRMARHLHYLRKRDAEGARLCERALYRAVLRGVDLHMCEDASLCAFVALSEGAEAEYRRDFTERDEG